MSFFACNLQRCAIGGFFSTLVYRRASVIYVVGFTASLFKDLQSADTYPYRKLIKSRRKRLGEASRESREARAAIHGGAEQWRERAAGRPRRRRSIVAWIQLRIYYRGNDYRSSPFPCFAAIIINGRSTPMNAHHPTPLPLPPLLSSSPHRC